jgi:hypothetical protein
MLYHAIMRPTIDRLEDDQVALEPNLDAVHDAAAAFLASPDASMQQAVNGALVELRAWFFLHLDLKDEKIQPAIAESMPPKQWGQLEGSPEVDPAHSLGLGGGCCRRGHRAPAQPGPARFPATSHSCRGCRGASAG